MDNANGYSGPLTGKETFFVVLNDGSGSDSANSVGRSISTLMEEAGRRVELIRAADGSKIVETARRAVALVKEAGGIVVAAGGDGTINAVSQEVLGSGLPFGVLPQGTFNYFGRNLGIPQDTEMTIRCLLDAKIQAVQVGLLNDRVFLVNASLGLYPRLLEDREVYKQRYGRSRTVAFWSALMTLFGVHRHLTVAIQHDGEVQRLRTQAIVVGNNALQLEQVGIEEAVDLGHDQLVAVSLKPQSPIALYGLLLRATAGLLGDADNINSFSFSDMTVSLGKRRKRIKVAVDGEIFHLPSPLTFRVAEHKLPLLVPKDPDLRERA